MREFFSQFKYKKNLYGIEVGVKKGENAQDIISQLDMKLLILVDNWIVYNKQTSTIEEIEAGFCDQDIVNSFRDEVYKFMIKDSRVVIIEKNSIDAAKYMTEKFKKVFDFVYIDANHRYQDVLADCLAWENVLKKNGVIGGHDYQHDRFKTEIQPAVHDFAEMINKPLMADGEDWWIQL